MELLTHTTTKQAKNEMKIVLDSSSSDGDDNSIFSGSLDNDEAEIEDEEEVACPFKRNIPEFVMRENEEVLARRM